MFFATINRERNLISYNPKNKLKDAKAYTYAEIKKLLIEKNSTYKINADNFLKNVMNNPFNNWTEY